MFARHKKPDHSNDVAVAPWRWPRSERAQRRLRAEAEAEQVNELRWQWRSVCTATALSDFIYTPSGATRAVPMIGRIDLGPPVSFTVRMRTGQVVADFTATAPLIARALGADTVQIVPLAPSWVRIVLLPAQVAPMPDRWSEPHVA